MTKADLLKLAGQYFISDAGLSTANLIRKIQIAEGHVDCFSTGKKNCDQMTCQWRKNCLPESAEMTPTEPASSLNDKKWEKAS